MVAGDTVQLGPTGLQLVVDHVDATTVYVVYTQTGNTTVSKASRLIVITQAAATYLDPYGATATSPAGVLAADSSGRVGFYSTMERVDCLVTGSGLTNRLYADLEAGHRSVDTTRLNAADFISIQAAIDALPLATGGTVCLPIGVTDLYEPLYFPCDRPCHLEGDSAGTLFAPGGAQTGSALRWHTNTGMVRVRGNGSSIRNVTLQCIAGAASAENSGYGVMIGRREVADAHPLPGQPSGQTEYQAGGSAVLKNVLLENVIIQGASGWGLYVPGAGNQSDYTVDGLGQPVPEADAIAPSNTQQGTISIWISCTRVHIQASKKYGSCFVGSGNTTLWFEECAFLTQGNTGNMSSPNPDAEYYAFLAVCTLATFERCTFEGSSPTPSPGRPWLRLQASQNVTIRDCWFENDQQFTNEGESVNYTPTYFVQAESGSQAITLESSRMTRGGGNQGILALIKLGQYVQDVNIGSLFAFSSSEMFSTSEDGVVSPKDANAIDLGGNTNVQVRVFGTHTVQSGVLESNGQLPPSYRAMFPIPISHLPRLSALEGEQFDTLPGAADAELYNDKPSLAFDWTRQPSNGAMAMNWDLAADDSAIGAPMLYWSGTGWRLLNNLPVLTSGQRDDRDAAAPRWAVGDTIFNDNFGVPEVRQFLSGSAPWKFLNAVPNFVSSTTPFRSFADGEMILKEKTGVTPLVCQLRVYIGGSWYAVDLTKLS